MISTKKGLGALVIVTAIGLVIACSKKSGSGDTQPTVNGFDKGAMLSNYANNLIIPAYTGLQQQIDALETGVNDFLNSPSATTQQALLPVFKTAYLQFEKVSVDQFGPAERVLFNNFLNTFPTDNAVIDGNINRGTYDLSINSAINQQGFPALDYLLFSANAVSKATATNSANYKKYVRDVVARMKTLTASVLNSWKTTYRAEFTGNTKSDAGSPIAFMINQFAFEMDQMKGPRIGWPYGKQSGGTQYPQNTEGYEAGISVALAVENLTNLKAMFNSGGSGKGMSDYLIALNKQQLSTDVLKQFDVAINSLKAIPDPLSSALFNNKTQVDAAYREIQILLTLIKTDVASATGVRITYQDTDGD
ncbi:imelysin family protein [Mucilaginibacter sp. CAU 1740]|uniref:imelysin family protein n=1 Tax=Mucilaginibacter sp. CAU 1740 TaxID=3140365 RepID=UPI00325BD00C